MIPDLSKNSRGPGKNGRKPLLGVINNVIFLTFRKRWWEMVIRDERIRKGDQNP
jgi:hypothetical protein